MKDNYLYLFLLFINLYMPISPYFCLAINIMMCIFLSHKNKRSLGNKLNGVILLSFIVLCLALFAALLYPKPEFEVIGKYIRCFLTTLVLVRLGGCFAISEDKLLTLTLAILFIHIATIPIQMLFPQIAPPMAAFFNCDRDPELFQRLSIRNMGTAGSFDMGAYFSIIGFVLSFATFNKTHNNKYLIFAFLFFLSLIRISRTGMLIGALFFAFCIFKYFKTVKKVNNKDIKSRIVFIAIIAGLITTLAVKIIPIISATTNLLDNTGLDKEEIEQLNDYGANSSVGLTTYHLDILHHIDTTTLIFGGAFSPNSTAYESDIGYVKMICNVGILGLLVILFLHYLIYRLLKKYTSNYCPNFSHFLIVSMIVVLIINYKNLIMYSRGAYDGLIFMTAVAINSSLYFKNKKLYA